MKPQGSSASQINEAHSIEEEKKDRPQQSVNQLARDFADDYFDPDLERPLEAEIEANPSNLDESLNDHAI